MGVKCDGRGIIISPSKFTTLFVYIVFFLTPLTERWVSESQQITEVKESAELALEEAFARLYRINKQQKAYEEKRKRLLDEAYVIINTEDEARQAEEEYKAFRVV